MLNLLEVANVQTGAFGLRVETAARMLAPAMQDSTKTWEESAPGAQLAKQVMTGSTAALSEVVFRVSASPSLEGPVSASGDIDVTDTHIKELVTNVLGEEHV